MRNLKGEILMELDVKSSIGRTYSEHEFTRIRTRTVNDVNGIPTAEEYTIIEDLQDRAKNNTLMGQLGFGTSININLRDATHLIKNIHINEKYLVADIIPLNSNTETFKEFINTLDNLIFRSRSSGKVSNDGLVELVEVFGFDAVMKIDDTFKIPDKRLKKKKILTERKITTTIKRNL